MHTGLISQALVIGQAQAAVYWTSAGLQALRRQTEGGFQDCSRQAAMLLDIPAEKRLLVDVSLDQLKDALDLWSCRQELLHWLIAGMDANLSERTRRLGLELAEEHADDGGALAFARARLLGCPVPDEADLTGALNLANDLERCAGLYREMTQVRAWIEPVSRLVRDLLTFDFSGDAPVDEVYRALVDQGLVAAAVELVAARQANSADELVVRFGHEAELLAVCPRLPHLLTAIAGRIKQAFGAVGLREVVSPSPAPEAAQAQGEDDAILEAAKAFSAERRRIKDDRRRKLPPADQTRQAIERQKNYILAQLDKGQDVESAVVDLIRNQTRNSLPQHLCKSLCDLGAQFTERGHFDLAQRVYGAARQVKPGDAVSFTGYAETLRELGRLDEAEAAYRDAQARFPRDAFCFTGFAETLRELGRLDEAEAAYRDAKNRFPRDAVCFNGLAETLRELGRLDEAEATYRDAQARFPKNVFCFTGLAETLRELGRLDEAETTYRDAKNRFPREAVCFNGLAETLRELGRLDEAEATYRDAKDRFPREVVCFNGLAETLRELGKLNEAEAAYRDAQAHFPRDNFCFNGLSETLRELGRLDEAEAAYRDTQARFPKDVVCFAGLAETLRELGRLDEAEAIYRDAKGRFPRNAVCFTGLAETLRELGRLDDAEASYRGVLKAFPSDRVALNALACLLLEQNKPFAIAEFLPLTQIRTKHDWWDFHVLAMAKLKQGLLSEAEEMFLRGVRETPFARSRAVFETSLTFVRLRLNRLDQIEVPPPISAQIIQFPVRTLLNAHALAAQAKFESAAQLLEALDKQSRRQIIDLSQAIRRRYGVGCSAEPSSQLDREIEEREFSLVLRAA